MANIEGQGINQDDLVTFLTLMNTNLTGLLAKLDDDTGVEDTDYESTYAITFPSTTISAGGIRSQGDILTFLNSWVTNYNATLAKLDADTGVADEDYVTNAAITDVIDNVAAGNLYQTGMNQSQLVNLLQTCITRFAIATAQLDNDDTVQDGNYGTLWNITDTIINTGCND